MFISDLAVVIRGGMRHCQIYGVILNFIVMWSSKCSRRALLSLFVALVFAIAAMPGSMAMPVPTKETGQQGQARQKMHCHDMVPQQKAPQKACKGACLGMLTCYGMGVLPAWSVDLFIATESHAAIFAYNSVSGLTIPPDDRPPIA